ncbi:MAG: hypothetical protein J0L80_11335 [Chitinophagales bacterium]|jgi:hypothetical protein|nr:hypothetical protein [Chitinophagales bacterium]
MRVLTTAVIAAAFFVQGCNLINPAEKIPTYIRVDSFKVKTNEPSRTGSASSRITSAFVYVDNSFIGAYDVPSTIPLLIDRDAVVTLGPGINYSGLKTYQYLYSFYNNDTVTVKHAPGKTVNYGAYAKYTDAAQFRWIEDFETGNSLTELDENSDTDTSLIRSTDPAKIYEGGGVGQIILTGTKTKSESINNKDITVKQGEGFIEVNYKCNVPFEFGLQTTINGAIYYEPIAGANVSESWNKIYIGIQSFLGSYNATAVRVVIKTKLPDGQSSGYVYLDNIKLITY